VLVGASDPPEPTGKDAVRTLNKFLKFTRRLPFDCRFVYNKALALNVERYEKKEKRLGYAGLCALLPTGKWSMSFCPMCQRKPCNKP
jgi:hypothetical protein